MDIKSTCVGTKEVTARSDEHFLDNSGCYDLTLIVENRKINVCRTVLCVASPVFQAMLKSDFKEKDEADIELPGKKYEDFVEFLSCFYPDKLKYLTEENVYTVLPFVIEYQVKVLEDRSHKLLVQLVKDKYTANEIEIYRHLQLAELYNLEELKNLCIQLASDFSLARMDTGSSAYPVSEQSVLQIRYMALQRKELDETDDKHLFHNASPSQFGVTSMTYKNLVKREIDNVTSSSSCSNLLRAARLCVRYYKDDNLLLSNITGKINERKPDELSNELEKELDLLPEVQCNQTAFKNMILREKHNFYSNGLF